jgi:hypothetical protein
MATAPDQKSLIEAVLADVAWLEANAATASMFAQCERLRNIDRGVDQILAITPHTEFGVCDILKDVAERVLAVGARTPKNVSVADQRNVIKLRAALAWLDGNVRTAEILKTMSHVAGAIDLLKTVTDAHALPPIELEALDAKLGLLNATVMARMAQNDPALRALMIHHLSQSSNTPVAAASAAELGVPNPHKK